MTHRRQQVLAEISDAIAQGEHVTLASLARRCGLYDYRNARRIMRDLERMAVIDGVCIFCKHGNPLI